MTIWSNFGFVVGDCERIPSKVGHCAGTCASPLVGHHIFSKPSRHIFPGAQHVCLDILRWTRPQTVSVANIWSLHILLGAWSRNVSWAHPNIFLRAGAQLASRSWPWALPGAPAQVFLWARSLINQLYHWVGSESWIDWSRRLGLSACRRGSHWWPESTLMIHTLGLRANCSDDFSLRGTFVAREQLIACWSRQKM